MSGCNRCLTGDFLTRQCVHCGHVDKFQLVAEPPRCGGCGGEPYPVMTWKCENPGLCQQCEGLIRSIAPTPDLAWLWIGQARSIIRMRPVEDTPELRARIREMERATAQNRPLILDCDPIEIERSALREAVTAGEKANAQLVIDIASTRADLELVKAEAVRLDALINMPQTSEFFEAVRAEAAHQVERWGVEHDAGKRVEDWIVLVSYLMGKATTAHFESKFDKLLHHIITLAAVALNWHRAMTGVSMSMRPGIGDDVRAIREEAYSAGARYGDSREDDDPVDWRVGFEAWIESIGGTVRRDEHGTVVTHPDAKKYGDEV